GNEIGPDARVQSNSARLRSKSSRALRRGNFSRRRIPGDVLLVSLEDLHLDVPDEHVGIVVGRTMKYVARTKGLDRHAGDGVNVVHLEQPGDVLLDPLIDAALGIAQWPALAGTCERCRQDREDGARDRHQQKALCSHSHFRFVPFSGAHRRSSRSTWTNHTRSDRVEGNGDRADQANARRDSTDERTPSQWPSQTDVSSQRWRERSNPTPAFFVRVTDGRDPPEATIAGTLEVNPPCPRNGSRQGRTNPRALFVQPAACFAGSPLPWPRRVRPPTALRVPTPPGRHPHKRSGALRLPGPPPPARVLRTWAAMAAQTG